MSYTPRHNRFSNSRERRPHHRLSPARAPMLCPPLALGLSLALVGCGWSVTTARSGCTRAFGLFTVESCSAQPLAEYSKVESSINAHSAIVHEFVGLTEPSTSSSLAAAVARKSLPFVDIEADSVPDPLHTINAGRADADIDRWGRDLAALRHPVMIAPLA